MLLNYHHEDGGFCRIVYERNNRFLCWQDEGPGTEVKPENLVLMTCTPSPWFESESPVQKLNPTVTFEAPHGDSKLANALKQRLQQEGIMQ